MNARAARLAPVALGIVVTAAFPAASAQMHDTGGLLRVGPARALQVPSAAARVARDGDTVEIDAGDYRGDVAVWPQSRLVIRAVGGQARIDAAGSSAEGKAVWVIKGDEVAIAGVQFRGARSVDANGAGIRHEGLRLVIRDCEFVDNEMGVLTWNDGRAELVVERSRFRHNTVGAVAAAQGRIGHQIYVGSIGRFTLRESEVRHGAVGHLVKSRARENLIVDNRLTDEPDGHASYELEFPHGGEARVEGNVIVQGARTENPVIIAYGAEGYRWPVNHLAVVNNTIVDRLPAGGIALKIWPGEVGTTLANNLFLGGQEPDRKLFPPGSGNARATEVDFENVRAGDYRLVASSPLIGQGRSDLGETRARSGYLGDGPRRTSRAMNPGASPAAAYGPAR